MAKTKEPATIPGMAHDQLAAHVRKTVERALGTSVEMGAVSLKMDGNELKLKLELKAQDVRLQLLPLDKPEKEDGAQVQDDLTTDS